MPYRIHLKTDPTPDDRAAVLDLIDAFNDAQTGPEPDVPLALLILDDADGSPQGGLWGRSYYGWLFIELLFVPAAARGQGVGTELLMRAEAEARRRGCHGVWLDSFSFQAPGFYEKHGYRAFGVLQDYPPGQRRVFLQKRLDSV